MTELFSHNPSFPSASDLTCEMATIAKGINVYKQLIDPDERWWRKSRLVRLNLWVLI